MTHAGAAVRRPETPRPAPRSQSGRLALVVAGYLVATFVMTWPYVNYAEFGRAIYGGDMQLIIWTLAWDNHALLARLPLFESNLFFPGSNTLRYNEHLFGLSVFTLPWAAMGASPVLAYTATWWLAFLFNGLAAFALLRRFVASDLAAFAGSLVFAYSFYVMLHAHAHLHLIWIWALPTSLLLLERWFDRPSVWRLLPWIALVVLEALTSWYLAVIVALANAAMALVLLPTLERRPGQGGEAGATLWRRRAAHMAGAAVIAGLCIYPFARYYIGLESTAAEAASFSATPASYVMPPANTVVGRWWVANVDARPGAIYGEQTIFVGWTPLVLAAIGLVALLLRRDLSHRAWVFPILALAGFLLSLGPSPSLPGGATLAPFHWLSALPGFGGMRAPARFAVLVTLGLAGLAAIGASTILRSRASWGRTLVVIAVPAMLLEWFVVDFPAGKPTPQPVPAIYQTPQVLAARSLVSLPDYRETERWFLGGDYLYYSTAHWRPIVNGFGRAEPPGHAELIDTVRAFPATSKQMRMLGVQYVVLHANRYPDGGEAILTAARTHQACRLVAQIGSDYLFELIDG
jgi:hypothetical protein